MLRDMKELDGFAINATDGIIGYVKDFYFDDEAWVIRYLIVETGGPLSSRKVLISPIAIGEPNWGERVLPLSITMEQVKNSPDIDTDKPVSRQQEELYLGYYGYPNYWEGAGLWGTGPYPRAVLTGVGYGGAGAEYARLQAQSARTQGAAQRRQDNDPHLRSCKVVMKYAIEATDGGIGHVRNLLVDDETWAIRYMVAATSNWWFGHDVLIAPQWIKEVRWADETVAVTLTQEAVKRAPPYDAKLPPSREHEKDLHQHHGTAGYWVREAERSGPDPHLITSATRGTVGKSRDR